MIVKLEFVKNVVGIFCDLNSIIDLCTNLPEGSKENLSEDSQSLDRYLNVRNPAQNRKFGRLDSTLKTVLTDRICAGGLEHGSGWGQEVGSYKYDKVPSSFIYVDICRMLSSGLYPSVCSLNANVSEQSVPC
jgi:hypothetical protein